MLDENPYEPPHSALDSAPKLSLGKLLTLVILVVLSVPSGAIAALAICGVADAMHLPMLLSFGIGSIAGLLMIALVIVSAVKIYRELPSR
jgi:hypothetical protein